MENESSQQESQMPHDLAFKEQSTGWIGIFSSAWAHRIRIAFFVAATTLIAIGITFTISPLYTAKTSILPELSKDKGLGLAGLTSLVEATGLGIGEVPISKLYPMIVKSERILRGVIYHQYRTESHNAPITLVQYWGIGGRNENVEFERALGKLRRRMDIDFDARLGTIIIGVEMEEPQLAADVANRISAELDDYTRTKRKTNATLQREFIEARLDEVERELERSELALKDFRERNRRIMDSPQLMLEQERFSREVQINSTVFIELKKQLEVAKIEEIKNIPIINVLDAARPPVVRSSPRRARTAVVTFFLSLVLSFTVAGFAEQGSITLRSLQQAIKSHPPVSGVLKVNQKKG